MVLGNSGNWRDKFTLTVLSNHVAIVVIAKILNRPISCLSSEAVSEMTTLHVCMYSFLLRMY